ncbi:MAG: site-specific DNA-methyltransferase [Prevotella sp.]|nr:site-specific DNA-methyltransferase [Prevotella sp.]
MATNYHDSFIKKLQEIFMMDHAELDFGIYRIMNQKRSEIEHFLKFELLPQVKTALAGAPDGSDNEVFSHLVTFFSRYYDNGDFISKRRYKDNTYAIPYNGEEVKLHWANADQYYIKSSEYFRDYTFVLPTSRRKVHFVLKDASTEQNNNKAANNMERRFALYKPENEEELFYEENGEELNIFFTYELMPKTTKQNDLMAEALGKISEIVPEPFSELLTVKSPTDKNANRTLLEKHLTDYTAKNSFDYFIHKDLGGFLRRELDFYIKNEVMLLDDLDAQHIASQLNIIKAIKTVGEKIIRMLAQLEDFQKKLWLKKKFVVQCDYCITLDRVPRELYPEILANDRQREEWVRLFAIDEIKSDLTTEGYSVPLTMEFLNQNPFLVLDTAFFSQQFKHKLLAHLGDKGIDKQCNGLLINSENFQALELLQEKYNKRIKCTYIDPPYNTSASEILYKNSYLKSSWSSLLFDRLVLGKKLLGGDGINCVTIDDFQLHELYYIIKNLYGEDNMLGTVAIKNNPSGRSTEKGFSIAHEYALYSSADSNTKIGRLERTQEQNDRYNESDSEGAFEWVNFRKHGGWKEDAPTMYYPIYITDKTIRIPKMLWCAAKSEYEILEAPIEGEKVLYPIDEEGVPRRWKWGIDRTLSSINQMLVKKDRTGQLAVYVKSRLNDKGILPLTIWDKTEYSSTSNGTNLLKNILGNVNAFSYPKSLYAVIDSLKVLNAMDSSIVIDYFAGSGTTGHAVIELNKKDLKNRKYILVEVNNYFDSATRTRIEKVIYSPDWKDGKPVSRQGISQCFKYMRLEQYEDTLNNLELKQQQMSAQFEDGSGFKESYMLSYMLDVETRDSLLNLKMFENPFAMTLKTTKDNELVETPVDMVETFNYLIGLNVETEDWYKGENICVVQGYTHRDNLHTLVIWRNCKEIDNEALNQFFERMDFRTRDSEFDLIYVNGDNTLPNLRRDEDNWKVVLIEEEFTKRMFETE